ncbi:winged helix-turn-helix domain-containing protein [Leptolyngbya sp. 7M]|uniref:winged helix-turn-helix domain-containing protein n=1 Tax=Leptolyngbya sp. 7M TaxID=2812896 RepID=UPI001B8BF4F8|nr:winged helix-turn-helix domain-containing protein [Leptolyngbya sp. 7M]QYO66046.1 winged helix-turn-helix domain-containing protein [Leptolyngbya sp. 7M]
MKKVLWRHNEPVPLALKEIEILGVLTAKPGEVVTKEELLDRVWGDSFVEESNLAQHVYRIRKTFQKLGESSQLIQTIPRRGYRFTGTTNEVAVGDLLIERRSLTRTTIEEVTSVGDDHRSKPVAKNLLAAAVIRWRYAALILVLAGLGMFGLVYSFSSSGRAIDSVAVLPLRWLDDTGSQDQRALGLTDALVSQLGKADGLRVVSLRSQGDRQAGNGDPVSIGRQIGVDAVLEGTVQQYQDDIRISLRLVRTSDGVQIWTTAIHENSENIFKLQDQIALESARAMSRTLRPDTIKHLTENRGAYEAYLNGRYISDKRKADEYPNAIAEFERAITFDPGFAAAYSGLADVYALQANISTGNKRDALYNRSKEMALKALELDPQSANALTSLAWVKRVHDWDWRGAEEDFRKAIEIDPNYVTARQWYALLLTTLKRHDEALFHMERARELEPLSRSVAMNLFAVRLYRGEYEKLHPIVEDLDRLARNEPTNVRLRITAHFRNADPNGAVAVGSGALEREKGEIKSDYLAAFMAMSYAAIADSSKARQFIEHLERRAKESTEAAYRLAQAYSVIGEKDRAIQLLEHCYHERDDRMVWLAVEPEFQSLRDDPRFKVILRQMNLSE